MIACVDSDYDYLLQGATHTSRYIINNKYVFHTYASVSYTHLDVYKRQMFHTPKWGLSVNNKLGWVLMEAPVFLVMLYLWWNSSVRFGRFTYRLCAVFVIAF